MRILLGFTLLLTLACQQTGQRPEMMKVQVGHQILEKSKKWREIESLKFIFIGGTKTQHRLFIKGASAWAPYINFKLEFLRTDKETGLWIKPELKKNIVPVTFIMENGSYSTVLGNDYSEFSPHNFVNIANNPANPIGFMGTVKHEVGHVLGLNHEHQHPERPYQSLSFTEVQCLKYFGLGKKQCHHNLGEIDINDRPQYIVPFDRDSIMHYEFMNFYIDGGFPKYVNTLSLGDKKFIAKMYPKKNPLSEEEIERMHKRDKKRHLKTFSSVISDRDFRI